MARLAPGRVNRLNDSLVRSGKSTRAPTALLSLLFNEREQFNGTLLIKKEERKIDTNTRLICIYIVQINPIGKAIINGCKGRLSSNEGVIK